MEGSCFFGQNLESTATFSILVAASWWILDPWESLSLWMMLFKTLYTFLHFPWLTAFRQFHHILNYLRDGTLPIGLVSPVGFVPRIFWRNKATRPQGTDSMTTTMTTRIFIITRYCLVKIAILRPLTGRSTGIVAGGKTLDFLSRSSWLCHNCQADFYGLKALYGFIGGFVP